MTEKVEKHKAEYQEASMLLRVALARLDEIKRAMTRTHSAELDAAAQGATAAVIGIQNAMRSGNLDASTLCALAGELNRSEDISLLVAESADGAAMATNIRLGGASFESHATVERFSDELFSRHLFDADVARHTHGAEFEAFKKREAEDEKYIHEQLSRHTAEGDLNASGKMQGYMLDANAHGAGDNPEFIRKWDELRAKTDNLRKAMRAAGQGTDEYDKHIRDDVAAFLKTKGLSDERIKRALEKGDDPLDAVKPYIASDKDSQKLANSISVDDTFEGAATAPITVTRHETQKDRPLVIDMGAMNAKLAAAGLDMTSEGKESSGHGLSVQKPVNTPDLIAR